MRRMSTVRTIAAPLRRRVGPAAVGLMLIAVIGGCASPAGNDAATPSATGGTGVVAEVASFQQVVDKPGRLLVALLSGDNRWVSFGSVRMSFKYLGSSTASPDPSVKMPDAQAGFLAIPETPEGKGKPPTLTFPADGRGVYGIESITFARAGYWQVRASGTLGDGTSFSAEAAFSVLAKRSVISVGEPAPRTDNPVIGDPGVPPSAIDSRATGGAAIPDALLHRTSIADAIGAHHPALVVFSTPVYCVSRFCGPVTDLIADLARQYADRADFIHVEIYRDFEKNQVNQVALDWLQTPDGDLREPWVFLIGADGRIAASWDTMVTRSEIEPLLKALPDK
jgi:hypothetical protein